MSQTKFNSVREKIQVPVSSILEGSFFSFYDGGFTCTRSHVTKTGDVEYFYTSLKTGNKVFGLVKPHNIVYRVTPYGSTVSVETKFLKPLSSLNRGDIFTYPLSSQSWKVVRFSKTNPNIYMCQLLNSRTRVVQGFSLDSKIVKQ